jgi:hypothetical protein
MKATVLKQREDIIKASGTTASAVSKAKEIVKIIEDPAFWSNLKLYVFFSMSHLHSLDMFTRICSHMEPLSIGINVCQGSHTQVDAVGLIFSQLYKHYTDLSATILLSCQEQIDLCFCIRSYPSDLH